MNSIRLKRSPSLPALLTALSLMALCTVKTQANDLTINLKLDQRSVMEIRLKIEGDLAITTAQGETERFNLKEMSWFDEKTNQWVTLAECKAWADRLKAKTIERAASAPTHARPFLLWSVNPTFKVEKSKDTLRLISGQVDYTIEGEASKANVDQYFRYAVLNSYKKSMTQKKVPAFSELRAIEEMKKLGYIPRKISITTPGLPGSPVFDVEIKETKP